MWGLEVALREKLWIQWAYPGPHGASFLVLYSQEYLAVENINYDS